MNGPFVSIITPTYNHARFIERCVRSVLEQSYPNWELIIVDDASTDGTRRSAEELAALDPRIQVIEHAEHRGAERLADTYNEALATSRGDMIAVLEGDDWWAPDRLSSQVPLLRDDASVILSYGDCWEVSETGRPIGHVAMRISPDSLRSSPPENIAHLATASVPANTALIRRDALERIGGFLSAGVPVTDYPTWVALSLQGDFVRVPRPIGYWRRHAGSVYRTHSSRIIAGCHEFFLAFTERNAEAIRAAGADPEALILRASGSLARKLSSLSYFDAKYELLCGDRFRALRKFLAVVGSPEASLRHRLAGLLGIGACLSSRRLFSLALATRRSMRGGGPSPAGVRSHAGGARA